MLATILPGSDLAPYLATLLPVSKQLCMTFPSLVCTAVGMLTKVRSAFIGDTAPGCLLPFEATQVAEVAVKVFEEIMQNCVINSI